MLKQKIGLIGVGNMGAAILEGIFRKKIASPHSVWIYDKISRKSSGFVRNWKVHRAHSVKEVVEHSDLVLLAVKPQDLTVLGPEIKQVARPGHLLISILAGTPVAKLRRCVGRKPGIVRAMPNLGARVGEAVTALTGDTGVALTSAGKIFSGCGKTVRIGEKYFDLVTAISGSGPAYFFLLMELLAETGRQCGLPRAQSELLAVQTAVGAALLAQASPLSPAELRQNVTSRKGTTEAALQVLKKKKFGQIFRQAVLAARARGRQLSRGM